MTPPRRRAHGTQADPLEFARFLNTLDPEPERAARAYVELHGRLRRLFEEHGCVDPAHLADTVFDIATRLMRRRRFKRILNPGGFAYRIAQYVLKTAKRQSMRELSPLEGEVAVPDETPDLDAARVADVRTECLERCLSQLTADERALILAYERSPPRGGTMKAVRKRLASTLHVSTRRLNRRAFDIRRKLLDCISECSAAKMSARE